MAKYILKDKLTKPDFDYILLTGNCFTEYYLYKSCEFEDAYNQLKAEFAKGNHNAVLCDLSFNTYKRDWRALPVFRLNRKNNTVMYDPYVTNALLHLKWYCDAGEWMNFREEWN